MTPNIRKATSRDRDALRDICLQTANSGEDATAQYGDADLPALIWVLPYVARQGAHAFVLEADDQPVGYVVGTADTRVFEAELDRSWWPELRAQHADHRPVGSLDSRVLALIADPPRARPEILGSFPAHLHINILPRLQQGGWGRRLIETLLDAVRQDGARGIHLGVSPTNARAIGFYKHLGFRNIDPKDPSLMGMSLKRAE